jgi:hypothetical protein
MARRSLSDGAEAFKVGRGCLGERIKLCQQIGDIIKGDAEHAGLDLDAGRQSGAIVVGGRQRNSHAGPRPRATQLVERFNQALPALLLDGKLCAGLERNQLFDQG